MRRVQGPERKAANAGQHPQFREGTRTVCILGARSDDAQQRRSGATQYPGNHPLAVRVDGAETIQQENHGAFGCDG